MNKNLALVLSLVSVVVSAESLHPDTWGHKPNLYTCESADGKITVRYSTTSKTGAPQLALKAPGLGMMGSQEEVRASGDDIDTAASPMGKLVTVNGGYVPDLQTTQYTLVVPNTNVDNLGSVEIETVLIATVHRTSIGGPRMVKGQVTSSEYVPVTCDARDVRF